jgi:hypothetical protein
VSGGGGGGGGVGRQGKQGNRFAAVNSIVRGKREREALDANSCPECAEFVEVLAHETGKDPRSLLRQCQRHRAQFPPVDTPDGYWDVGF